MAKKRLLEIILHSCEKLWYSSPGLITYLLCDVNASPCGLMSVAAHSPRVSLQTTGVAAWLSPGIPRVAPIDHRCAGSARFQSLHASRVTSEMLLWAPCMFDHHFMYSARMGTFSVARVQKWNAGNHYCGGSPAHTDMWLGGWVDRQMGALSLPCLWCKPINIFPLERAAAAAAAVAVKAGLWSPVGETRPYLHGGFNQFRQIISRFWNVIPWMHPW